MKFAKKALAFLLTAALICVPMAAAAQAATGAGAKFVVLGDSISAGEGASAKEKSYAELVAAEKKFKLSNFAVSGDASGDLLKILANNEAAKKAIREADIIDLSIGGNDLLASNVITLVLRLLFLKDAHAVDEYVTSFRANFAEIIKQIRGMNKNAKFIVQTLYNSMAGIPLVEEAYEIAVLRINEVFTDYLKAHPGAYELADIYTAFKGRDGMVFRDRLHPADAGHAEIARVLTAMINGKPLELKPAAVKEPNFFQKIGIFFRAAADYIGYWLTKMTPLELLRKAISFIV